MEWEEREGLVKVEKEGEGNKVVVKEVEEGTGNKGWSLGGWFGGAKEKVESVVEKVVVGKEEKKETTGEEYALIESFCAGVWSGLGMFPFSLFSLLISC